MGSQISQKQILGPFLFSHGVEPTVPTSDARPRVSQGGVASHAGKSVLLTGSPAEASRATSGPPGQPTNELIDERPNE